MSAAAAHRDETPEERVYRHRYIIAAAVSLASMMQVIDTSIVNVAIPHMMGNLGATVEEISWVSTGYIIAAAIIIPLTGWLSDFFGRKRYFIGSIVLFTIASFLCGTSRTLGELVLWRIVQGVGGGALISTSQAILWESFPREEVGTGMAFFGMGVMVGPTLGPTLGGWITDNYSWPWIFFINVPVGILAVAMIGAYVHDHPEQVRSKRVDGIGIGLLIVAVGAVQLMLERGERLDWFDSNLVTGLGVASVVAAILLVWHELRIGAPRDRPAPAQAGPVHGRLGHGHRAGRGPVRLGVHPADLPAGHAAHDGLADRADHPAGRDRLGRVDGRGG